MKKKCLALSAFLLMSCISLPIHAIDSIGFKEQAAPTQIIVNNRVLAKVNGKYISTYDLAKKMDMLFYKQFPEYITSVDARHQFYQANWKSVLEDLIHKELVLADAQEMKMAVSGGDVRQEMEALFGPNMIENLDKSNMSFDEAYKMVEGDLVIQRMINMRIYAKALRLATPSKVRQSYEEFIQNPDNARLNQWRYQVITIHDRTPKQAEETANKAYRLLIEENVPIDQLVSTMKTKKILGRKAKVTLSDEILNNEKEISKDYFTILSQMDAGMISQPSEHKSRANKTTVYRIFFVKEKIPGGMPSFNELEGRLKERLLNQIADLETDIYLKKMRHHFHVREQDLGSAISPDYQPFMLK